MSYLNWIMFLLLAIGQSLRSEIEIVRYFEIQDYGKRSTDSILNLIKERKEGIDSDGRKSYGYLDRYLVNNKSYPQPDYVFNNPPFEIQKVDRYWSRLPSKIELLENKVSNLEKEWLKNLPTFGQVKDKAKRYKTVPVIKNLYLWQSFEHATVALDNIIDGGKVRVDFFYDLERPSDWKELGVIFHTSLYNSSDHRLVTISNLDWKDTPYDKASFEARLNGGFSYEIHNDFVNGSTRRMPRSTDIIRFWRKGLSEILGINDETYKKLHPSYDARRKISYKSFIANLFEKKYSNLNVDFDDNYVSYRKTKEPHFGVALPRYDLVIMRTLQGHRDAPKSRILESQKKIEGNLLKAFE